MNPIHKNDNHKRKKNLLKIENCDWNNELYPVTNPQQFWDNNKTNIIYEMKYKTNQNKKSNGNDMLIAMIGC